MRKWTIAMVATVSLFVGIFISDKAVQASGINTPIHDRAVAMAAAAIHDKAAAAYNCPSGYMCLYTGFNGTGAVYVINGTQIGCHKLPAAWDNSTRSIQNNTAYNYHVFTTPDNINCVTSGAEWSTVWAHSTGNMSGSFDQTITLYKRS